MIKDQMLSALHQKPTTRKSVTHISIKANQVLSWDITWLPASIEGMYYKLYVMLNLFSRKIGGWEIWETEEASHAVYLLLKSILKEEIKGRSLVLHSDNGSPMKAQTSQSMLEKLGITKTFSRPLVSNDNPYLERFL